VRPPQAAEAKVRQTGHHNKYFKFGKKIDFLIQQILNCWAEYKEI